MVPHHKLLEKNCLRTVSPETYTIGLNVFLQIASKFQCQVLTPQFDPPFGGLGWTQGVEHGANRNIVPTFLFDFCTH